ncbi:DegV family protein [Parasporobacterium paucivorans]|uniref:EDD domain protein, DegV family n=1 Tax=Parasporobacterium paucivorans DSM 15970 TaxID=1122934 RepID=A0A1M6FM76_9FIRM|nr:DegV family protein [Parasporobacterium paucivorans]SHI98800.1 EDD domain protein, DegV family [Parasporobacterium paucivorans DSM 15970]
MKKIAVATDSNSGITQNQANILGIEVLPMPFYIGGKLYFEGINLTQDEFYLKLEGDSDVSTSQPSQEAILKLWNKVLKRHDELVYIPMSAGLSEAYETARMLAGKYEGKVTVVDNRRISITQRQSVLEALAMARKGMSALHIKQKLEDHKDESCIFVTVETLKYLKKGGRITPTVDAIGTVLEVKPILQIRGDKLDEFSSSRGKSQARKLMIKAIREEMNAKYAEAFENRDMNIMAAYAGNEEEAWDWKAEIEDEFPGYPIHMSPVSLSVACHIGHGSLAIACTKKLK